MNFFYGRGKTSVEAGGGGLWWLLNTHQTWRFFYDHCITIASGGSVHAPTKILSVYYQ